MPNNRMNSSTKMKLNTTSAPHIPARISVQKVMLMVCLALIPATLAHMYYFGKGVEKDYNHAFNIYSDIKLSHDAIVYLMLGRIYNYGYLGRNDLRKAKINYLKSIAKGNIPAIRNLAYLEKNNGNHFTFIKLMIITLYKAFKIVYKNPKDYRLRDK